MNKIWVVARREYLATVRTKAFLIGIVMMPLMMGLGGVIGAVSRQMEDQGERRFAVDVRERLAGQARGGHPRLDDRDGRHPRIAQPVAPPGRFSRIQ